MPLRFRLSCLAGALFAAAVASAQVIPNAGFESWSNGNPAGWTTNNGLYTFITRVTTVHGGASAAQGSVVNMGTITMFPSLVSETQTGQGFPVSQRYATLHGYYQFVPVGGDFFMMTYLAEKNAAGVGSGAFVETQPQAVFKEFVAQILYPGSDVPDEGTITFTISGTGGLPHVGSTFIVDDLSFGPATGVADAQDGSPKSFRLGQNYPNPFNPTTNILYEVPGQSHVTLTVVDVLGREVAVLVNQEQPPGKYRAVFDASNLPSGVYFYRLAAGTFVQAHRMMLLR